MKKRLFVRPLGGSFVCSFEGVVRARVRVRVCCVGACVCVRAVTPHSKPHGVSSSGPSSSEN